MPYFKSILTPVRVNKINIKRVKKFIKNDYSTTRVGYIREYDYKLYIGLQYIKRPYEFGLIYLGEINYKKNSFMLCEVELSLLGELDSLIITKIIEIAPTL